MTASGQTAAALEEAGAAPEKPFSNLLPVIIGGALMMHNLNSTVISPALPAMAVSLHESPLRLNTTISIYLFAMAVFLPISGWAADRFGAKRVFLIAIGLYAVSAAACGFATNLPQLLIARAAAGASGALLAPVGRVLLLRSTPKHQIVQALSTLSVPLLLGGVMGPPIGGFMVTYFNWRWIFFINLPLALLGLVLVNRFVEDVAEEGAQVPFDWTGIVLTTVSMALFIYGLENIGHDDQPSWVMPALLAGGLATLIAYVRHAERTPHAILDLKLFRIRTFFASIIGGNFMRMGLGATPFLLALLLLVAFGFSPLEVGMMTFASAAAALVMKTTVPPILARFGFRWTLSVNAVITGASFIGCAFFTRTMPHWVIYAVLLCGGFFRSLQSTALNSLAYADIDERQMSGASTLSAIFQRMCQSIGITVAATMVHLFQVRTHAPHVTAEAIKPAFIVIGVICALSGLFFVVLPADAGERLVSQPRRGDGRT